MKRNDGNDFKIVHSDDGRMTVLPYGARDRYLNIRLSRANAAELEVQEEASILDQLPYVFHPATSSGRQATFISKIA